MKRHLIALSAVFAATTPALAGNLAPAPVDAPVVAPAPVPVAPIGVDWTGPYVGAQLGYGFGDADGTDFDGVLGGVHAGYNYDLGNWVVGAELDYNFANLELDGSDDTIDQIGRLKAKAGYEIGQALLYGTAGGAYAEADVGGSTLSDFGWVAGAGVDYMVSDNIIAGVEYLYHGFDDFDDSGVDVDASTVAAKVSFKF